MKLRLFPIGGELEASAEEREHSQQHIAELDRALEERRAVVRHGWGPEKVHRKGKLTTWERLERLVDPGSPILPVNTLVNWGRDFAGSEKQAPGAGVVTAFGRVHGRWVMVIANDNTVASGAWWPLSPEKIERGQQMALRLRLPVVYLVDCSGLFLPEQSHSFPGRTGAGHIFKKNSELSAAGVPQIAGVFGDSIAGGGYMPIISDRVYMTEGAYMVIAGAALIKGAKSLHLTSLDIGGPEVHVHQSACADVRVPDDETCLRHLREEVARLPGSGADFYRHGVQPEAPLYDPGELEQILPRDHRHIYDIRQVVARLVDGSLFHEFMPEVGREVLTGVGRVGGLWVGFAANVLEPQPHPEGKGHRPGGILYREGIAKLAAFSRACNDDGLPLVWLQDIAGFDIGVEAEALGLLGYGSSLIYSNSTNSNPVFTVLLRKASGAGYYAMAGLPYEPVIQLATPLSRLSVMEGRTLAIATYNSKLDDDFEIATTDPEERRRIEEGMARTAARIEADMDPVGAAARMDTDELIRLRELRPWLQALAEMAYQATGYRRVKNPRIWSLHDLEVLASGRRAEAPAEAGAGHAAHVDQEPPEAGAVPVRAPMEGSVFLRPAPDQPPFVQVGQQVEAGAKVGLVEVMKTFTAVRAPAAGVVLRVDLPEGAAVRAGQPVLWLRPGGGLAT
ncbi:propionyl-CoA carboxylase [Myxococcota bacterium]|nr:propionyl-CoA carboxylase [Myxococcota bacterium]